jgi:hypothetical protein
MWSPSQHNSQTPSNKSNPHPSQCRLPSPLYSTSVAGLDSGQLQPLPASPTISPARHLPPLSTPPRGTTKPYPFLPALIRRRPPPFLASRETTRVLRGNRSRGRQIFFFDAPTGPNPSICRGGAVLPPPPQISLSPSSPVFQTQRRHGSNIFLSFVGFFLGSVWCSGRKISLHPPVISTRGNSRRATNGDGHTQGVPSNDGRAWVAATDDHRRPTTADPPQIGSRRVLSVLPFSSSSSVPFCGTLSGFFSFHSLN